MTFIRTDCICAFVSCMIACALCDGRSVRIECGQEEISALLEMCDRQTLNSWFQIMLRFMHLPTVIFMSFSLWSVCKMSVTLALIEKYDFQCTQLPRIPSALLITVFTSFLITFLLNIYLWEILCHLRYKYVYFTHLFFLIHFQMISNFLNLIKINNYIGHPAFQDIGIGCQKKQYRSTTRWNATFLRASRVSANFIKFFKMSISNRISVWYDIN